MKNHFLKILIITGIISFIIFNYNFLAAADAEDSNYRETENIMKNINLTVFNIENNPKVLLRDLAEKYQWLLFFDSRNKTISIYDKRNTIKFKINENEFRDREMKTSPTIKNGRTYLGIDWINPIFESLEQETVEILTDLKLDKHEVTRGDTVEANIKAYNIKDEIITLNYSSGQLFDLWLLKGGEEVWRWSEGKFFTMALMSRDLEPYVKKEHNLEIPIDEDMELGSYLVNGELATESPLELQEKELKILE